MVDLYTVRKCCSLGMLSGIAALIGGVDPAQAAASAPADSAAEPAASASNGLEEIVVTATRRSETKQTTPVTITAISGSDLSDRGITNIVDVQKLSPGIILNGTGTTDNTTFSIRGQSKAVTGPGLPSVITYVNEVPLPSWGSAPPTFDVDNIQVLKGPQGTAFGRNTTGGAVLVYTTQPTYDFGGYVQGQFGSYTDKEFQGAINIPLIQDKLAIRIAAEQEDRKGFVRNVGVGKDSQGKQDYGYRISVLFEPIDGLKNVTIYDYLKNTAFNSSVVLGDLAPALLGPTIAAINAKGGRSTPWVTDDIIAPVNRSIFWTLTNTTTADLGIVTVKNIAGYRSTNLYNEGDVAAIGAAPLPPSFGPLVDPGQPGVYIHTLNYRADTQFTDELQFSGTALNNNLNWLAGGFYALDQPSGPDSLDIDIYRPLVPNAALTFYSNNFLNGASLAGAAADNLFIDKSKSMFVSTTYKLGQLSPVLDQFKLNLGYRYTWDTEGVCSNGRQAISNTTGKPLVQAYQSLSECSVAPNAFSGLGHFSNGSYTAGLDYTITDNVFVYITNRTGYRAGGINTPGFGGTPLAPFQDYQPQKVKDYEIGIHDRWQVGDWRGQLNIAAFLDKYTGLQLQASGILAGAVLDGVTLTPSNAPTNTAVNINAGAATFKGVEIDGSISPFRGLNLSYGAAYLNPSYDSLTVAPVLAPFFAASHFSASPRWSYQASGQYVLPFRPPSVGGDISINADYYHLGQQYQNFYLQPAFGVADFYLHWKDIANEPVDVSLYVTNAFNKFYATSVGLSSLGFPVFAGAVGEPRMYGIRARYTFGK